MTQAEASERDLDFSSSLDQPSCSGGSGQALRVGIGLLAADVLLPFLFDSATAANLILMPAWVICLAFTFSAIQALLEVAVAWPILKVRSWLSFRAWWEGVLIGYGMCGLFCWLMQRPIIIADGIYAQAGAFPLWQLLISTFLMSFAIQWGVMSFRSRYWKLSFSGTRLMLGVFWAKLVVGFLWTLLLTR